MTCAEVLTLLPDHLKGAALPEAAAQHLAACPACRQEYEALEALWAALGELPHPEASPDLRFRVLAGRSRRREWMLAAAAACLLAVGSAALGWFLRPGSGSADPAGRAAQGTLRLVHSASSAERMKGLAMVGTGDRALVDTLLDLVDRDPETQVRLAAVESLYLFAGDADLRSRLVEALSRQDRPEVQVALVNLVVGLREKQALEAMRRLGREGRLTPGLKRRIDAGMDGLDRSPL